ncbi:MAG: TRAP transporter small permease [Rhodospirillaceae bacterium]|nr:TRAP transporter small permease [Rhodospirillaceae bacterium]
MLTRLFRVLDRIGQAFVYAGMIFLSGTVAVSMADIVGRKTTGFSVLGIDDIVSLTVMACVSLAMPLTYLREGHVAVEFVTDMLPPRGLAAVKALGAVLTAGFVAVLAWFAFKQAGQQIAQGDRSNTLAIPIIWYWGPLLAGMAASALCGLVLALRLAATALGFAPPPERTRPEAEIA